MNAEMRRKMLEALEAIYFDSVGAVMDCYHKSKSAAQGQAGDLRKILYDNVRTLGEVAVAITAVKEKEAAEPPAMPGTPSPAPLLPPLAKPIAKNYP